MYKGQAENDLGIRTDILNNISKSIGIEMLIRSMAPKVIVCDEIGNKDDVSAIYHTICSGIKGIFTAHGTNIEYLKMNPIFSEMFSLNLFDKIIFLDSNEKGKIRNLYKKKRGSSITCDVMCSHTLSP